MVGLLDLRERGERLEPPRFAADPTVTETVGEILGRVRAEGDPATIELTPVQTGHAAAMGAQKGQR